MTWSELPALGLHLKGDFLDIDDITLEIGHVDYRNYPLGVKKKKKSLYFEELFVSAECDSIWMDTQIGIWDCHTQVPGGIQKGALYLEQRQRHDTVKIRYP